MFDIVFPNKNEKEFIKLATSLGFKGLVFVYDEFHEYKHKADIEIYSAVLSNSIRKARKKSNLILCNKIEGQVLEKDTPDILFDIEKNCGKDFMHHRNSRLNQVYAGLMSKKNIAYGLGFSMLLDIRLFGKCRQNLKLWKKKDAFSSSIICQTSISNEITS